MTTKVSIALCVPAFHPAADYGGPVPTVSALARALADRGHLVQVWCADYSSQKGRVPAGRRSVNGVDVRYFRRVAAYKWAPIVPQAILAPLRLHPDIVHCFGVRDGMTMTAALGCAVSRVPFVIEPMGMLKPIISHRGAKRWFDASVGKVVLRAAKGVIATSTFENREFDDLRIPGRRWLRPNPLELDAGTGQGHRPRPDGVTARRSTLGIGGDEFVVGYIGRLHQKKGLDMLVAAANKSPGVRFVVAGPDSGDGTLAQLRKVVEQLGVSDRVQLLGPVWGEDRDQLLRCFDLFVLPSRSENFGNAAAEAAALGVPVIVTDRCGVADQVRELGCGMVVEADPTAIASEIRRLRGQPHERASMAAAGCRIAELLRPERIAEAQEAIYLAALSGNVHG